MEEHMIADSPLIEEREIHARDVVSYQRLERRVFVDVSSALAAGVVVAPIVTAIDVTVAKKAFSPATSFLHHLRDTVWSRPSLFASRPCFFMLLLYSSTYAVANISDTIESVQHNSPPETTHSSIYKFSAVSAVNISMSLAKDNQIAKFCGGGTKMRRMPWICYPPLLIRDGISLFATFNLPAQLAPRLSTDVEKVMPRLMVMQVALPIVSQIPNTPFHLFGLQLYHRQTLSRGERWRQIKEAYTASTIARIFRVIPGLALGNVANTALRRRLMTDM